MNLVLWKFNHTTPKAEISTEATEKIQWARMHTHKKSHKYIHGYTRPQDIFDEIRILD
jgi:hypothetical protein